MALLTSAPCFYRGLFFYRKSLCAFGGDMNGYLDEFICYLTN
ncbi:hypothetical protein yberc0001_18680 [Yersinia bercovieri ATCC 43970]|uniref:Uncharacterized protein n=1 Tax=Yersinia bercovieri ATCC 43970 TaxID=349968 RepID=A0ABM9XYA4_YERBE|nr:hypothetical protein yberc0001_18680 [Yersinia bercovieri ATCC 43970]